MTISYVGDSGLIETVSGTISRTCPTVTAGDIIVLHYFVRDTTTETLPSGFSRDATVSAVSSFGLTQSTNIASKIATGSESGTTLSISGSASRSSMTISVFRATAGSFIAGNTGSDSGDIIPAIAGTSPFVAAGAGSDVIPPGYTAVGGGSWVFLGGAARSGAAYEISNSGSSSAAGTFTIGAGSLPDRRVVGAVYEESAGVAPTAFPSPLQNLSYQYAAVAAVRLNGVLQ